VVGLNRSVGRDGKRGRIDRPGASFYKDALPPGSDAQAASQRQANQEHPSLIGIGRAGGTSRRGAEHPID
jgi:hypothetical protein